MDMFPSTTKVTKEIMTSTGHFLAEHDGACRFAHGHNYKWQVTIKGENDPDTRLFMIDFSDFKRVLNDTIGAWDHAYLTPWTEEELDVLWATHRVSWGYLGFTSRERLYGLGVEPTAENMARIAFEMVGIALLDMGIDFMLLFVRVYETDTSYAEFIGDRLCLNNS